MSIPNRTLAVAGSFARDWIPVTPSDVTDNMKGATSDIVLGFYVTVGGAVSFITEGGTRTITYPTGAVVYCTSCTRIKSTGTTATGLFSLVI